MDKIKQQKIELYKDERNSTNNKNENERLNMILSVIDRVYQFFEYKFLPNKQLDELKLPKWVETNVDGKEITLDNAESLLKGIASQKIMEVSLKESTTI